MIEKGYRVSLCRQNRSIDAGRLGTELFPVTSNRVRQRKSPGFKISRMEAADLNLNETGDGTMTSKSTGLANQRIESARMAWVSRRGKAMRRTDQR
jgi:hypothetical protein